MTKQQVVIIGSGYGGLAAAALLGKAGYTVTVLEKNEQLGGRAGLYEAGGFRFDTGPSWFLMPDVFERFFTELGEDMHQHLDLIKLAPSYRVFYKGTGTQLDMTGNLDTDAATFEAIESGAGERLRQYLTRSAYVYDMAVGKFLYKNYDSWRDLLRWDLLRDGLRLRLTASMDSYVRSYFKDERLQHIMEYPLVFLGASPYNAPALYNLLSHVDFTQGVFYPQGGIYEVTKTLVRLAKKHGAKLRTHTPVEGIVVKAGRAVGVVANGRHIAADIVVSDADIYHTETQLLPPAQRDHSPSYWRSRTLAPSALLLYVGVDCQYANLRHHNLVFSPDWKTNFAEIFDHPQLPNDPSYYVCAPSKTDPSVAPAGHENLFVLVPLASGLEYTDVQLAEYIDKTLAAMEIDMQLPDLRQHIVYQKHFCVKDFASRYNSYQGTGLGLAHTLLQTALFRPSSRSKKVQNLYYVGANVHPGIGMPTTLISAQLLLQRLQKRPNPSP